ncbi:hypothetical protein Q8791_16725 [Nocardiopsis sp. CT-R113]|uniref:Uncharacterized protein n=1 Tax=Nocardiopsis codii TaxID=3065942 RepID=A0ABU7K9F0_9ACTN|nr:hypothetical protein [Nocardiopsis sp. CT-R113]MEE2038869.1 hypothetical protein [Nocardiopsis sp. CT-R113]
MFGRHNDEFLTPYNPASPLGAGAFDNAAKAATARQDFGDLFARNFGEHLGESAARDLGRDYADTLARHWNNPNLGQHLRETIGDRLPPHMRDHLSDVPVNLQKPLNDYFSTTGAYAQQTGGNIGSGALEGYLGEGLGSLADGRGWEASVFSATAGASQAGIQQGATDGALHGLDLFNNKDTPDLATPPPRTESDSSIERGSDPPWNGNGWPPSESGSDRWDYGPDGENRGGEDRAGRDRDGGPDRNVPPATATNGTGDRDATPAPSSQDDGQSTNNRDVTPAPAGQGDGQSTNDRDDTPDVDDAPDLVSDTGSDTDSDFGDPDDRDRTPDDTVRVHDDPDTRTPDTGKDPFATTDTKPLGLDNDPYLPGMNDGPLTVNFLNAIVPDNPLATPPPATDQTTPNTNHNDNPANTNPVDSTAPEPQQQDTTAPLTVAPPFGQPTPPPTGQQPPPTAPNNPTTDNNQRPTPSERDGAAHSPQSTGDTHTPDPSVHRSADDDVPTVRTESGPPQPADTTPLPGAPDHLFPAPTPLPDSQGEQADQGAAPPARSEDQDGDRPRDNDGEQDGDRPRDSDGDRDGASPAVPVPPPLVTPPPGQVTPPPAPTAGQANPSPQTTPNRITTAIRLGELASASIKDAISGYQHAQDLVDQTREAESQGRPDADDLRTRAHEAQRGANEAYRTYDHLAQMQADLLRPDGPTTVMTVETTGGSSRDTGPVPLGGTSRDIPLGPLSTDPPARPGDDLTGNTPDPAAPPPTGSEAPPPPTPRFDYEGTVAPDRGAGESHDLGYLTTSTLLGQHMLLTEPVPDFVRDVLNSTPGMPEQVRREIGDHALDVLTREGPRRFFQGEGHTLSATDAGGTWKATFRLRPGEDGFFHVDTPASSGGGDPRSIWLHDLGPGVNSTEGGSSGPGKTVGAKLTVNPFYVGDVGGNSAGPTFSAGGRFGTDVRSTGFSAASKATSDSGLEMIGKPTVYVADLHMAASVTGPGLDAPHTPNGTGYNGLAINLPGGAVSNKDAPEHILLTDAPVGADGHRGPVNRPSSGTSHPIEVSAITPVTGAAGGTGTAGGTTAASGSGAPGSGGGRRTTSLGSWLADHLLGKGPDETRPPGHKPTRAERAAADFRGRIERAFAGDQVQQYLPQMTNSPAHLRIQTPDGRSSIMRMWSVPTEYHRKDFAPGLTDFLHRNVSQRDNSSSVTGSTVVTGTASLGFGIWLELPGGRSVRLDVPTVEYAASYESDTGVTRDQSGLTNHTVNNPAGHAAYDVKRDYYVHLQGEPNPHRFEGASVELLTIEDARLLNGEPPKAPAPEGSADGTDTAASTVQPPQPPRPPFPNLAVDHPTDLSGATLRGFGHAPPATTPPAAPGETPAQGSPAGDTSPTGTTGNNGTDGGTRAAPVPQRTFYDELAHRVLTAIADKRPGLVIPDITRTRADYATRPSHMGDDAHRTPRERYLLRRNHEIAQANTLKILNGLGESNLKSSGHDLPGDGVAIRLTEPAVIDPAMLALDKGLRPDHVTVRVAAAFGRLEHTFDTSAGGGARSTGSAGITTTKGSNFTHSVTGTVGGIIRDESSQDARGVPRVTGAPSVSLVKSWGSGHSEARSVTRSAEDTVYFIGDSDQWTSRVRFDARLFEHDDIGLARDDRHPMERGIPLLGKGMDGEASLLTPKAPPATGSSDTPARPATGADTRSTTRDTPRETAPDGITPAAPHGQDGATNPPGTEHTTTLASPEDVPPATATVVGDPTPLTPQQAEEIIRGNFVPTPRTPPAPATTAAPTTTGTTGTDDAATAVTTGGRGTDPEPPPGDNGPSTTGRGTGPEEHPRDAPSLNVRRAREIIHRGGTVERVSTDFDTRTRGRRGLLEETYRAFSSPRQGLFDGYRLKLDRFLTSSTGGGRLFENVLSSENLATNKGATGPGGARTRQDTGGGFRSPHQVRTTVATKVDVDSVTDFRAVDAQIQWNGVQEIKLSTSSTKTDSLTLRGGAVSGRNPNPQPGEDSLPSEAVRPTPAAGPSASRTLTSANTAATHSDTFSSAVLFVPNMEKVYAFRGSGHLTQAFEFLKNWSIGPPLNWNTRFRGWTVPVQDLVSGYFHARDAHEAGLVLDRVQRTDSGLELVPQPNPKSPETARVRPGFEHSGRQMRPADPSAALQSLVDDLAANDLELTGDSRETLLHALTTNLGNNPSPTVPVPVKVRSAGAHTEEDSAPHRMRAADGAKVYVHLDKRTGPGDARYVGGSVSYSETHTWKASDAFSESRNTVTTASVNGVLRQPLPYTGDESGPEAQPDHRPLALSPAGGVSASTKDSRSTGVTEDDSRIVKLRMKTPYVKVTAQTTLTLTLELDKPRSFVHGGDSRTAYRGSGDGGRVDTVYPSPYVVFTPPEAPAVVATGTTGGGEGGDGTAPRTGAEDAASPAGSDAGRNASDSRDPAASAATGEQGTPPAPDTATADTSSTAGTDAPRPALHYASVPDMMRDQSADGGSRAGDDSAPVLPTTVEDDARPLRNTAAVVVARTLGWTPPADASQNGRYTQAAADAAYAHVARELGLDPKYNTIDHHINTLALKAVYPSAATNDDGVGLTSMGRTEWALKVLSDTANARILDVVPGSQLSVSRTVAGTDTFGSGRTAGSGTGGELRPTGTTSGGLPYDDHRGVQTGDASVDTHTAQGSSAGGSQAVKGYPESTVLRQGPAYLIEYDATWAIGAATRLKAPGLLHQGDASLPKTPLHSRPTRWDVEHTTVRMTGWISESDAVARGILTPEQAEAMTGALDKLDTTRTSFTDSEKKYAGARTPLEGLAERYVGNPDDTGRAKAYADAATEYGQALTELDTALDSWVGAVNGARAALAAPTPEPGTAPLPPATESPAPDPHTARDDRSTPTITVTSPAAEPAPTGPRQSLVDRFRSELNLTPPSHEAPAPPAVGDGANRDGGTADTARQHARDADTDAAEVTRDLRGTRDAVGDAERALTGERPPGEAAPNARDAVTAARTAADAAHAAAVSAGEQAAEGARAGLPDTVTARVPPIVRAGEQAADPADSARGAADQRTAEVSALEGDLALLDADKGPDATAPGTPPGSAGGRDGLGEDPETREARLRDQRSGAVRTAAHLDGLAGSADTARVNAENTRDSAARAETGAKKTARDAEALRADAEAQRDRAQRASDAAARHRGAAGQAANDARTAAARADSAAAAARDVARQARDAAAAARTALDRADRITRDAERARNEARAARTEADRAIRRALAGERGTTDRTATGPRTQGNGTGPADARAARGTAAQAHREALAAAERAAAAATEARRLAALAEDLRTRADAVAAQAGAAATRAADALRAAEAAEAAARATGDAADAAAAKARSARDSADEARTSAEAAAAVAAGAAADAEKARAAAVRLAAQARTRAEAARALALALGEALRNLRGSGNGSTTAAGTAPLPSAGDGSDRSAAPAHSGRS